MANIDQGFNVDILSLSDSTLMTSGEFDPRTVGYEAPQGSIFAFKNGALSALLLKTGTLDTDWVDVASLGNLPIGGIAGDVLIKTSPTNYDAYWGILTADQAPYAKKLVTFVRNDDSVTLPKGTPVYQIGNVGDSWTISVGAADADVSAKMPAIGVLAQDLAPTATGDMIVLGEIRDVDTSSFAPSDLIYVAPGGGYTNIKPTTTGTAIQFLGIVTKIHPTNGGGYVTGTGAVDMIRKVSGNGFEGWNGSAWESITSNIDAALDGKVNISGDSMTGSLSLPKTKGEALLVDNSYSWMDIIGDIRPKTLGTSSAIQEVYYDTITGWTHRAGTYGELFYHIPHEYAPNTDLYFHIHWGHNGTAIQGTLKINFWVSYAKREYPATAFSAPIQTSITLSSLDMTNSVRYCHRVDEVLLSTLTGAVDKLKTEDIETDGVIKIHYEVDTIPSINGSTVENLPYIFTFDIHMQSTNIGTKNKDPNFWA